MNTMNECFFFTKYEFSKTKNQDLKKGQEIYKTIVLSESQYYIEKLSKINQFKEKKKNSSINVKYRKQLYFLIIK